MSLHAHISFYSVIQMMKISFKIDLMKQKTLSIISVAMVILFCLYILIGFVMKFIFCIPYLFVAVNTCLLNIVLLKLRM